jgi:hypothetical protein
MHWRPVNKISIYKAKDLSQWFMPIYLRIIVKGIAKEISTYRLCDPNRCNTMWDDAKARRKMQNYLTLIPIYYKQKCIKPNVSCLKKMNSFLLK